MQGCCCAVNTSRKGVQRAQRWNATPTGGYLGIVLPRFVSCEAGSDRWPKQTAASAKAEGLSTWPQSCLYTQVLLEFSSSATTTYKLCTSSYMPEDRSEKILQMHPRRDFNRANTFLFPVLFPFWHSPCPMAAGSTKWVHLCSGQVMTITANLCWALTGLCQELSHLFFAAQCQAIVIREMMQSFNYFYTGGNWGKDVKLYSHQLDARNKVFNVYSKM